VSDEASSLRRHSSLVAAGIGLSRLSGLVRDAVLAFFLGANVGADAFRAALKIPNLLQNLLGEGVLSASFIPSYSRLVHEGREREAAHLAGAVLGLLLVVAGALTLTGVLAARPLTRLLTPGFVGERFELTVLLVRIMFPGIGVLVISAWCLGVLNSHRRFFLSYVAPVLWNTGILASLIGLGATAVLDPALAAGVGVVLGGLLQTAVQVPAVRRLLGGRIRLSLDTTSAHVRRVLAAFWPIVLGRGVVQVAALLDLVVASLLAVGAVAVLGYAQTLYLLPIALFGMSVAAAELPELSRLDERGHEALTRRLDAGLARGSFFVVGTTAGFWVLGGSLVALLYGRGEFDRATVVQVGAVVVVYSFALVPSTASRLLQSVLYAGGDARTPAVIAALRVTMSLSIGLPLMLLFDQLVVDLSRPANFRTADDVEQIALRLVDPALREATTNQLRLGAIGLAMGAVAGSVLEYLLLRWRLRRRGFRVRLGGGTLGRLMVAGLLAVFVMRRVVPQVQGALVDVVVPGVLGGLTYLGVCVVLRVPEARALVDGVTRRRRRGPRTPEEP